MCHPYNFVKLGSVCPIIFCVERSSERRSPSYAKVQNIVVRFCYRGSCITVESCISFLHTSLRNIALAHEQDIGKGAHAPYNRRQKGMF